MTTTNFSFPVIPHRLEYSPWPCHPPNAFPILPLTPLPLVGSVGPSEAALTAASTSAHTIVSTSLSQQSLETDLEWKASSHTLFYHCTRPQPLHHFQSTGQSSPSQIRQNPTRG